MQVSSPSSLTWLQSANATSGQTSSAASTDGQDLLDASGAEGASPSSVLASLQNPSQQFSAGSLNTLISAQLDQSSTGTTHAFASQTASTQSHPGLVHGGASNTHHRHGGGGRGAIASQPIIHQQTTDASSTSDTDAADTTQTVAAT